MSEGGATEIGGGGAARVCTGYDPSVSVPYDGFMTWHVTRLMASSIMLREHVDP